MTKEKYSIPLVYFFVISSIFISMILYRNDANYTLYKNINIFIWIITSILAIRIPNEHCRFKGKAEKIKTVVIIEIIYIVVYMLSGLILGFEKSPYSHKILDILRNSISILVLAILQEYVRVKLINTTKNITLRIVITVMFIFAHIDYLTLIDNTATPGIIFKYFSSTLFILILTDALLSFLAIAGGFKLNLIYITIEKLIILISPVFPAENWFITTTIKSVTLFTIFAFINFEHETKLRRFTRKETKQINPIYNIPILILLVLFVSFVEGLLPYKPVALMSNSMYPLLKRGYVVVGKDITTEEDLQKLKVGDIIQYQLNTSYIVHRIVGIETDNNGKLLFTTKGDNNLTNDAKKVTSEQVLTKLEFYIPYIVYPSVLLNENIFMVRSEIDT